MKGLETVGLHVLSCALRWDRERCDMAGQPPPQADETHAEPWSQPSIRHQTR